MADFTINSLSSGSLSDGDNIIKSNSSGALTKVSKAQLVTDILGSDNFGLMGDTISKALRQTSLLRAYTQVNSDLLTGTVTFKRYGNNVTAEIFGLGTTAQLNIGQTYKLFPLDIIPTGYKPNPLAQLSVLTAFTSTGTVSPAVIIVHSENGITLTPQRANIPAGAALYSTISYNTEDVYPE